MRCSKGSKDIRTEHRTESNLEPFDTGSVRTGTLVYRAKFTNYQSIFKITPLVTQCKKRYGYYEKNLIVTEKSTTSITFLNVFLKHDVCANLYILWQCFYSNWFCHFYRKHTVHFQDFVHSLSYSSHMHLTNTYHS